MDPVDPVDTDTLRGRVLVSNGSLFDPNFRHTVALVVEHNDEGALGVVLNRPTDVPAAEAVPALAALVSPGEPIYQGGPVQVGAAVVLAEFEDPGAAAHPVFGSIGLITGEVEALGAIRRARAYAGYSGWGPGQLERELEESSWIVEAATADDVFTPYPERLWSDILERKGGRFEMLARMPFDPSTN